MPYSNLFYDYLPFDLQDYILKLRLNNILSKKYKVEKTIALICDNYIKDILSDITNEVNWINTNSETIGFLLRLTSIRYFLKYLSKKANKFIGRFLIKNFIRECIHSADIFRELIHYNNSNIYSLYNNKDHQFYNDYVGILIETIYYNISVLEKKTGINKSENYNIYVN